ncbi:MAG TPA: hypothetical protein VGH24_05935 [Solirubrobacteraceae bacterium]
MSADAQLMLMIAGMHLFGLGCAVALILPALRDRPEAPPGSDSDGGGGGRGPSDPVAPATGPGGGLPLPDADPAHVRLRDHRRLADHQPHRERRPAREPDRSPVRTS